MQNINIRSMNQRFQVRSAIGGIADYADRGILGSFKFGSGLDIRKQNDSLSCNQGLTTEGAGVITDLILWLVPSFDGYVYGFGDTGKIYRRHPSTYVWTLVRTDTGKITGAAEWIHEGYLNTYSGSLSPSLSPSASPSPSSGATATNYKHYLYWAVGSTLHRKEIPGASNWSDVDEGDAWPKINLDNVDWHTMAVADASLLICNGNKLAMVGFDESYTEEALRFYPDELSKTIIERQGYAIIGTYKETDVEKGALYSWNSIATSYIQRKEVPAKGVNGLVDTELTLMQAGDKGSFYYSDMINVLAVNSIHEDSKVNPNGVDIDDGLGLFGMYGGSNSGVYSLGRKRKNAPFVLNLEYPLTATEIGAVKNIGNTILISYQYSSTHSVKRVDSTIKGTGTYYSLDLVAPKEFVRPLHWKSVVLRTKNMPNGSSITLSYKVNKATSWTSARMQDAEISFTAGTEAVFLIGAEGSIFEFKIVLTPVGNLSPEIFLPVYVNFE